MICSLYKSFVSFAHHPSSWFFFQLTPTESWIWIQFYFGFCIRCDRRTTFHFPSQLRMEYCFSLLFSYNHRNVSDSLGKLYWLFSLANNFHKKVDTKTNFDCVWYFVSPKNGNEFKPICKRWNKEIELGFSQMANVMLSFHGCHDRAPKKEN